MLAWFSSRKKRSGERERDVVVVCGVVPWLGLLVQGVDARI
jgi:hypothetical protein